MTDLMPDDDVSTVEARRNAYSLLLNKGLIRIEQQVPATAEFTVLNNDNPYGCTSTTAVSAYRRPYPRRISLSQHDYVGRARNAEESRRHIPTDRERPGTTSKRRNDGARASAAPTPEQVQQIIDFETKSLRRKCGIARQASSMTAGRRAAWARFRNRSFTWALTTHWLESNRSCIYFNDFHLYDSGTNQRPAARRIYGGATLGGARTAHFQHAADSDHWSCRVDDALKQPVINGFCGTCHDAPNVGDHSVPAPLNIGLVDPSRRTPDLPLSQSFATRLVCRRK